MIIVIPHKRKQVNDFYFTNDHKNGTSFVQRHITKSKPAIVKLLGRLYDNMDSNDDVSINNSNSRNDDIGMVLLALFIPWERFPKYFTESKAINSTILSLCWNIWCKCLPTLNAHVQFYTTNLLQMRKNRLKARAATESRAENNCLDITDVFENKILYDSIEAKDSLRDLSILNN